MFPRIQFKKKKGGLRHFSLSTLSSTWPDLTHTHPVHMRVTNKTDVVPILQPLMSVVFKVKSNEKLRILEEDFGKDRLPSQQTF